MGVFNKCVRCGETIGAIPGGIWIEALKGEVCMACYEEIAAASEGLEPGQAPVIPPLEREKAEEKHGRRAKSAASEEDGLGAIRASLDKIRVLLIYIAVAVTVGVVALLLRGG